jgi:hypothetical protein
MKLMQKSIVSLFGGLLVLGLGATAQAQDPPPPSEPPPPAATRHSSGGGGGGAGIGVGASQFLSDGGPGAAVGQFVFDQAIWHVEGFLGFASAEVGGGDRLTTVVFGAGGWYHLHSGSSSDFSLGGLIAVNTNSGPGDSTTVTAFEPGAQVRAFVTPNVAAHARVGLAVNFGDTGSGGTEVALLGQVTGAFGFTYFFR